MFIEITMTQLLGPGPHDVVCKQKCIIENPC